MRINLARATAPSSSGYKGVGKSSVIMQVLGMIRDPLGVVEGQVLTLPPDLPEPENRERWLILSVSGKLAPSVDAIADALQKAVLSTFEGVEDEVERRTAGMLDIRWYHHLFKRREKKLFAEVQSALTTFSLMIDFVRAWQGSRRVWRQVPRLLRRGIDIRVAHWVLARALPTKYPELLVSTEAAILGEDAALLRAFEAGLIEGLAEQPDDILGVPRWVRRIHDLLRRRPCLLVVTEVDAIAEEELPGWLPSGPGECTVLVLSKSAQRGLQRERDAIAVVLPPLPLAQARDLHSIAATPRKLP